MVGADARPREEGRTVGRGPEEAPEGAGRLDATAGLLEQGSRWKAGPETSGDAGTRPRRARAAPRRRPLCRSHFNCGAAVVLRPIRNTPGAGGSRGALPPGAAGDWPGGGAAQPRPGASRSRADPQEGTAAARKGHRVAGTGTSPNSTAPSTSVASDCSTRSSWRSAGGGTTPAPASATAG